MELGAILYFYRGNPGIRINNYCNKKMKKMCLYHFMKNLILK